MATIQVRSCGGRGGLYNRCCANMATIHVRSSLVVKGSFLKIYQFKWSRTVAEKKGIRNRMSGTKFLWIEGIAYKRLSWFRWQGSWNSRVRARRCGSVGLPSRMNLQHFVFVLLSVVAVAFCVRWGNSGYRNDSGREWSWIDPIHLLHRCVQSWTNGLSLVLVGWCHLPTACFVLRWYSVWNKCFESMTFASLGCRPSQQNRSLHYMRLGKADKQKKLSRYDIPLHQLKL